MSFITTPTVLFLGHFDENNRNMYSAGVSGSISIRKARGANSTSFVLPNHFFNGVSCCDEGQSPALPPRCASLSVLQNTNTHQGSVTLPEVSLNDIFIYHREPHRADRNTTRLLTPPSLQLCCPFYTGSIGC
ncbi:hypothetical protein EYF80_038358 [Liparis tanakae]|uniref:Uncharacterized protein n=1 Tax=Liparis tanakae TaxID=230148 RepID=A0A4Z2GCZ3_9TELE|nr:hypothetical protein EYF80_038358 [Liparis tanakae]